MLLSFCLIFFGFNLALLIKLLLIKKRILGKSRDPRLTILKILVELEMNQDLTKLLIELDLKQYLKKNREVYMIGIYLG